MVITLTSKNKHYFVDGSLTKLASNSHNYKAWDKVNSIIIALTGWILGVLEFSIAKSVLRFSTSMEIQVEIGERYGQSSLAQLFSLKEEVCVISQSSEESVEFFTKMKSLWDEQDNINLLPTCSCIVALTT